MSTKEQLNQAISTGMQAQRLLKDDLLSALIFGKKNHVCESFMLTNAGDDKKRKELWQEAQGYIAIERELQLLVENGMMAQKELEETGDTVQFNNPHNPFEK